MPLPHRNRYRAYSGQMHRCQVPGCSKWAPSFLFCCHQHNALLPYTLRCDFQTAWTYRDLEPARFETMRAQALARWGWTAGLPSKEAPCPTS